MQKMITYLIFSILLTIAYNSPTATAQTPSQWQSRGIGGGGALFAPSISQTDDNTFSVACDMSELFYTNDFGETYTTKPFKQIQGGHNAKICFTNDNNLQYAIDYGATGNYTPVPVKSTDAGTTWTILTGNPDNAEETQGIWVDYNNPQRIIIAYYSTIYLSNNGGNNFNNIHNATNSGAGVIVGGILFDNNNIYIGTNDGVLVSSNGGSSFSTANITGLPTNERIWSFAAAKQGNTTRFFCITADVNDLYVGIMGWDYWGFMRNIYTTDYTGTATTWTLSMNGINPDTDFLMYAAMAQNDITTCYLAGSREGIPLVLKTNDGGTSWQSVFNTTNNQNIATGWCGQNGDRGWGYAESIFGIAVAPTNPNKLIITDYGFVHTSNNGGTSWKQAYLQTDNQNTPNQNTPTAKNYTGIGLENTSCWQVFWNNEQDIYGCFSDIRGIRSTDAGNTWAFNYTGQPDNSLYRITKHNTNNTIYAATATIHDLYQSTYLTDARIDNGDGAVRFSSNNGQTWQTLHDFNHPVIWITTDPNNNNTLYAAVVHSTQGGIFVTNNLQNGAAATWTQLPNPPRTEGHPFNITVLNNGKLLATYSARRNTSGAFTPSSGIFLYDPTANTWTDKSTAAMYYWTKDLTIDHTDTTQNTWLVSVFSGWGGPPNGLGGLYRTTDGGTTWTKINNIDRVSSCTISPYNSNEAYLTTETNGLWHTDNIHLPNPTFQQIDNYPFRQPERVFFNPYNQNEIWVTNFGNGIRVGTTTPCSFSPNITGTQNTCANNTYSYAVTPIAGSTYNWTVIGGNITEGQNTNQITVLWNNNTVGQINIEQTTP